MSTDFKWTVDLLAEFIKDYSDMEGTASELMEQFKESKQPKPEWEIIQVSSPECGLYYLDGYKMRPNDKIYSVKRLPDGEIFTVGDRYRNEVGMKEYTIREFEIRDDRLRVNANELGFDYFSDLIKIKPLITTEDGVAISNGLLHVCSVGKTTFEISECRADLIQKGHHDHYFYFSCRAKAEEYVLWNKPCLSLSEVLTRYNCVGGKDNQFIECIKNLAKINLEK